MQQIDSIEAGLTLHIDQVFEVPTPEVIGSADGADGEMSGVLDLQYLVVTTTEEGRSQLQIESSRLGGQAVS